MTHGFSLFLFEIATTHKISTVRIRIIYLFFSCLKSLKERYQAKLWKMRYKRKLPWTVLEELSFLCSISILVTVHWKLCILIMTQKTKGKAKPRYHEYSFFSSKIFFVTRIEMMIYVYDFKSESFTFWRYNWPHEVVLCSGVAIPRQKPTCCGAWVSLRVVKGQ